MSKIIGDKIIRLEQVDSTNTYVKKNIDLIEHHGLVIITKMQTSGRGRLGRKFISLPNKNVTFSVILHSDFPLEKIHLYSLLAGIVVSRVLENYIDNVKLKWPNDVLVRGKKVCGILIETIKNKKLHQTCIILGIGINTKGFIKDYPVELQGIITTIEEEMYRESKINNNFDKYSTLENEKIFKELLKELEICIEFFTANGKRGKIIKNDFQNQKLLIQEWLDRSRSVGLKVRCLNNTEENKNNSENTGIIEGLTNEGFLLIRKESGELITHMSGDIVEII